MFSALGGYAGLSCAQPTLCGEIFYCEAPVSGIGGSQITSHLYLGVSWEFGKSAITEPDWVLGLRRLDTKSKSDVTGWDANLRWSKQQDGYKLDSSRVYLVKGRTDVLGHLGVGYSYLNASPLISLGGQFGRVRLHGDMQTTNQKWSAHGEFNTLSTPRVGASGLTCPQGSLLHYVDGNPVVDSTYDSVIVNGQTCLVQ